MIRSLLWLCVSTLLTIAGFAGALPAAATVMERQGLSAGAIGVITSLVYAGVLCMAPFQPWLARRFNSVPTYQMGKVLSACGFIGLSLAHAEWMWSAATLFIGLGAGLTWPVTDSLVASFAPENKKGAWMGLFQTGMGAAFALGPFIAAALALNPNTMFVTAAITGVATSLPLIGEMLSNGFPEPAQAPWNTPGLCLDKPSFLSKAAWFRARGFLFIQDGLGRV